MGDRNIFKRFLRRGFRRVVLIIGREGLGIGGYVGRIRIVKKIETKISKYMRPEFVMFKGHKIYLDEADALRLSSFGTEYHETDENKIYDTYIKEGDVVLDIGAFIGDNSLDFAKLVGNKGKVYAFEINKKSYELLKKNIEANNYKNIIPLYKAVSNKTGKTSHYIHPFRSSGDKIHERDSLNNPIDWKVEEIECVRLDDFIKGRVDFIKVDTEGAEPLVFQGAQKVLKKNKNLKILLEFSPATAGNFGMTVEDFLKNFIKLGFKIYKAEGFMSATPVRIEQETIKNFLEEHQKKMLNLFLIRE